MELGFIIFIAFAVLIQSSRAQQSTVYGLSTSKSAELRGIEDNQDATLLADFSAVDRVFDIIEMQSAMRKYDLECKTENVSSRVTEALNMANNATDNLFDSITTTMGKNCSVVEVARNGTYADSQNVFKQIGSAIELAVSGNYTDFRTEFEVHSVASKKAVEHLFEGLYDAIRTCVNTTNADTLDAIKVREKGSTDAIVRTSDAIFDAIKVFAAGISTESYDVAIIPDLKDCRKKATLGIRNFVEHSFGLMRGLYLSAQLNESSAAASLNSDQYVQIASDFRYKEGTKVLFDVVESYLTKIRYGLSDGCSDDSSAIDAAEAESSEYYQSAIRVLGESIPTPNSVASAAVRAALKFFKIFTHGAAAAYYSGIRLAKSRGSTYSEALKKIKMAQTGLRNACTNFVRTIFTLLQLGGITGTQLASYQNNTLVAVVGCVDNVFVGVNVLARACHGTKPVTDDDFDELQTARNDLGYAVGNFTSNISSGHVAVMKIVDGITDSVRSILSTPSKIGASLGFNFG